MSDFVLPGEPPPGFELNDVTETAAQVLLRMLERDGDEIPDWLRKAAAGVDPTSNGVGEHREPLELTDGDMAAPEGDYPHVVDLSEETPGGDQQQGGGNRAPAKRLHDELSSRWTSRRP